MRPDLVTTSNKKLVGNRLRMSFANNRTGELWKGFMPQVKKISGRVSSELISLSIYEGSFFTQFNPANFFDKWAAVEVSDFIDIPDGMETLVLLGGEYAVFHYKGLSSDPSIHQYIFGEWLPQSEYVLDIRPHFEILGDKYSNNSPDSEEDIYIPISPK